MADTTLSWSTNTDWENAQARARVCTHDLGSRSGNDIVLGLDPDHGPAADARHYWHCDETGGTTAEDAISGDHGTYQNSPNLGADGAFDSNAPTFPSGGEAHITAGNPTYLGHDKSHTLLTFIHPYDDDKRWGVIFMNGSGKGTWKTQVKDADSNARLTAYHYPHDNQDWQGSSTFFYDEVTEDPMPVVFRYDNDPSGNSCEIAVWYDGAKETEVTSDAREDSTGNVDVYMGRQRAGSRYWFGKLDEFVYWDRALSDSEVDTLLRAFEDGYLTTAWKQDSGRADSIDVTASLDADDTAECTIRQDASGDGSVDASERIQLKNGTNNYTLDSFDGATNGQYSLRFDLYAGGPTASPTISSATLNITSISAASWDGGTDGVLRTDASGVIQTT